MTTAQDGGKVVSFTHRPSLAPRKYTWYSFLFTVVKVVPLEAWSGPEGSRKLRLTDFMTTAQDGGKVVSFMHRPSLAPRKYTWYSFLFTVVKAVPLQAWSGPEGSRELRFPDFMTTAQDGGKVVSLTHRPPLAPRKYTWYSFLLEAESTPGP